MVSTAKSDGHLRLRYVLPAEKHKKTQRSTFGGIQYIYNNTNIDIYIYNISIPTYIYIHTIYTHAHQSSSESYSQSLISPIGWVTPGVAWQPTVRALHSPVATHLGPETGGTW